MSTQSKVYKAQPDWKNKRKLERAILPKQIQQSDGAEIPINLLNDMTTQPSDVQAANLSDARFQTAQRRSLAGQVGHLQGNTVLQRLVTSGATHLEPIGTEPGDYLQRQPNTTTEETALPATAGPEMRFTEFGTFAIYPNDFVGPLPVADYATGGWPVRQMIFDRIQSVIESISGGGAGIAIEGQKVYKAAVLMDLAWLMTVSAGRDLIEEIVATGKNLTIKSTSGGNSASYVPDGDSFEILPEGEGPLTAGAGANVTIEYNTQEWNPYGGEEVWMNRPPAIGLSHEMVHAWTGMKGIRARGETAGVRRRELQATGLGEFAEAVHSENRFRAAFGLPPRPRY